MQKPSDFYSLKFHNLIMDTQKQLPFAPLALGEIAKMAQPARSARTGAAGDDKENPGAKLDTSMSKPAYNHSSTPRPDELENAPAKQALEVRKPFTQAK